MSKEIEALELLEELKKPHYVDGRLPLFAKCRFDKIEQELKEGEENKQILNIFKDALTIEHHDYPIVELDDSKDTISCFAKQLCTIKQNELDKSLRKALREWVLKNAFPKELKALEIIIEKEVNIQNFKICLSVKWEYELFEENCSDNDEYNEMPPYKHSMTKEQFELLRKVICHE